MMLPGIPQGHRTGLLVCVGIMAVTTVGGASLMFAVRGTEAANDAALLLGFTTAVILGLWHVALHQGLLNQMEAMQKPSGPVMREHAHMFWPHHELIVQEALFTKTSGIRRITHQSDFERFEDLNRAWAHQMQYPIADGLKVAIGVMLVAEPSTMHRLIQPPEGMVAYTPEELAECIMLAKLYLNG